MEKRRLPKKENQRPDSANHTDLFPDSLPRRPAKREEIDSRAGCSNAPELVAELRRRGLDVPCERVPALDRDGRACRPGVYHLTEADRRKVARWMYSRSAGFIAPELAGWLALLAVAATLAGWR